MAIKKGPTKGSGGKHRNALRGKGPTPKAEDRVYHKAYKAKQATNRRKMADPRLAARRRAAKFTSDSDDLVIGRNAVLEALRGEGTVLFHIVPIEAWVTETEYLFSVEPSNFASEYGRMMGAEV